MSLGNVSSTLLSAVVWTPSTVEEAWQKKKEHGSNACFISGGTLLQTEWERGDPVPKHVISLEKIQQMRGVNIELDGNRTALKIGSLTTLADCRHHPLITNEWALLSEAAKHIAAPAVRNRGTIGGNVANGRGDSIPALLVLDAEVTFLTDAGCRTEGLWEWLKKQSCPAAGNDAILTSISLPEAVKGKTSRGFYKKIGRREAFVASLVTVSGYWLQTEKGMIEHIRLAAGGAENEPQRLPTCESLLLGTVPDERLWQKLYATILAEFQAVSDAFASAEYRKKAAANVILSELSASIVS